MGVRVNEEDTVAEGVENSEFVVDADHEDWAV